MGPIFKIFMLLKEKPHFILHWTTMPAARLDGFFFVLVWLKGQKRAPILKVYQQRYFKVHKMIRQDCRLLLIQVNLCPGTICRINIWLVSQSTHSNQLDHKKAFSSSRSLDGLHGRGQQYTLHMSVL